jgi:putative membrane protein
VWHDGPGWGMMGGWGWGIGGGGMIFWLVVIVLIVAAVAWFVRPTAHSDGAPRGEPRSRGLDVLEERYARGEINRDEYLQKRRDILG